VSKNLAKTAPFRSKTLQIGPEMLRQGPQSGGRLELVPTDELRDWARRSAERIEVER
jgi:hypothetical protein